MQYHYISDKELYHFGRSKRDGAKVGSGRYPLGSGNSKYKNRMALKIEEDYKNKNYYNPTGKTINKKEGASLTLFTERMRTNRNMEKRGLVTSGIGVLGVLGGSVATALTMNPAFFAAGMGAMIAAAGAGGVFNVRDNFRAKDLNELAAAYNVPESDVINKRGININMK